jgi:DNA-binding Lrp family transcriptional regulator
MAALSEFDAVDRRILDELAHDARIPNKVLAARVQLSESGCSARVRRLQDRGLVRGFHAELDLEQLGRPLQALISIRYRHRQRQRVERFTSDLIALPWTLALFHVTGNADYVLHVAVSDTNALRRFVLDSLLSRPEVDRIETSIVYEHRRGAVSAS